MKAIKIFECKLYRPVLMYTIIIIIVLHTAIQKYMGDREVKQQTNSMDQIALSIVSEGFRLFHKKNV